MKTKLCMLCQISHIKGFNPATDAKNHCWGEMGDNCECDCKHSEERIKQADAINESFKARQRMGLI